jgi:hypothetical protein
VIEQIEEARLGIVEHLFGDRLASGWTFFRHG